MQRLFQFFISVSFNLRQFGKDIYLDIYQIVVYTYDIYQSYGDVMTQTAKIFMNGRSQAVRLPADFRFDGDEVFIEKDPITGDVILSSKPQDWDDLFSLIQNESAPDNFLNEKEREQVNDRRDPFDGWVE